MEQIGVALDFFAFYTASKLGKTGLTVTCTVRDRAGTAIVTAQAATELAGGLYRYTLTSGNNTAEGEYIAVFTTSDTTVDQRDIPALWTINKAGIEDLDAAISSRLATSGYTAPDNASLTTLTGRLTATRAGLLDNLSRLSVDVNTLLTAVGYTAPDNATIAMLATRLSAGRATLLDNLSHLNADISALLTAAGYTAPDNAGIGTLVARLTATRAGLLDNLSRLDIAISTLVNLVWNEAVSSHQIAGSMGKAIGDAGAAGGDPLDNPVPGSYAAGTAGYALARVGALGTGVTVVSGPVVSEGGLIKLVAGDSYFASEGRALTWTSSSWPSLVGATVMMFVRTNMEYPCSVAGQVVSLELSDEVTRGLLGQYPYELIATLGNGHFQTLAQGTLLVERV